MDFEEYVLIGVGVVVVEALRFGVMWAIDRITGGEGVTNASGKIAYALIMDKLAQLERTQEEHEQRLDDLDEEQENILERLSAAEEDLGVE